MRKKTYLEKREKIKYDEKKDCLFHLITKRIEEAFISNNGKTSAL